MRQATASAGLRKGQARQRPGGSEATIVVDLGVGTGLCGPWLASLSPERLVGVDLSPEMLAQAEARGMYDELLAADVIEALQDGRARGGSPTIATAIPPGTGGGGEGGGGCVRRGR